MGGEASTEAATQQQEEEVDTTIRAEGSGAEGSGAEGSQAEGSDDGEVKEDPITGVEHLLDAYENKDDDKNFLVPFVTGGFPGKEYTVPILKAFQEGGAAVLELGIPYSDPQADGPTIQRSSFQALEKGTTPTDCINWVKEARSQGVSVPILLMTYYSPVFIYGDEKFCQDCAEAGANGFIMVDLPLEEGQEFRNIALKYGLSLVPLVTPTTSDNRLKMINEFGSTMIYALSQNQITGSESQLNQNLAAYIENVRKYIKHNVAVGFGIRTRDQVENVLKSADGAVVGSQIIREIEAACKENQEVEFVAKKVLEYIAGLTGKVLPPPPEEVKNAGSQPEENAAGSKPEETGSKPEEENPNGQPEEAVEATTTADGSKPEQPPPALEEVAQTAN